MPPQIVIPDGYVLERLDTSRHERNSFSCGKDPLDQYLRTQAAQAQEKGFSNTHVLIETVDHLPEGEKHPIAAYVTLVGSEIPLADCPPKLKRLSTKPRLPAMLLSRMARDLRHKGKRLGDALITIALTKAWEMKQVMGCFLVAVDAKDNEAKDVYIKYGFMALPEKPMRLVLPMSVIEKLPNSN